MSSEDEGGCCGGCAAAIGILFLAAVLGMGVQVFRYFAGV